MSFIVNQVLYDSFDLLDNANAAITGKTSSDFTKSAYLVSNAADTAAVTVANIGISSSYKVSFTPDAVGVWKCTIVYNSGGVYRMFASTYDVVAAPTPVTVSASDLLAASLSGSDPGTVGGALAKIDTRLDAPVSSRAAAGAFASSASVGQNASTTSIEWVEVIPT